MSFIINQKIEEEMVDFSVKILDSEPYNYIYFKGTGFTDGSFVRDDPRHLEFILKNADPQLISLLNYRQDLLVRDKTSKHSFIIEDYNTALHKALKDQNNTSVNLILLNLMNLQFDTFKNFTSIFEDLVDYPNFMDLLIKLPIQTPMMRQR
jgi:hypothetical protein